MRLNRYVDVLIPRGGAGLIRAVVENSTIPVIETGTGNCHIYVDETADLSMAVRIITNAKTQRIGVCNACESLVVHERVLNRLLPLLRQELAAVHDVELRGDARGRARRQILKDPAKATEEDWGNGISGLYPLRKDSIFHRRGYRAYQPIQYRAFGGHRHRKDYANAQKFLDEIDAAAVYVNASTRFTDGFEFGFGAEIGISTQKLHARGPMGLLALTTTKYIIYGNGQVR